MSEDNNADKFIKVSSRNATVTFVQCCCDAFVPVFHHQRQERDLLLHAQQIDCIICWFYQWGFKKKKKDNYYFFCDCLNPSQDVSSLIHQSAFIAVLLITHLFSYNIWESTNLSCVIMFIHGILSRAGICSMTALLSVSLCEGINRSRKIWSQVAPGFYSRVRLSS